MEKRNKFPQEKTRFKVYGSSKDINRLNNENKSINSIEHSGNSDVDVNIEVNVDTTAIGFAILCSLLATGQVSDMEFQRAVKKFEDLSKVKTNNFFGQDLNTLSNLKLFIPEKLLEQ
ncbi:hypothetical protein V7138_01510 [Bacillus sp. JJ1533]|uniref:hypothetical protein n=1 Tax=Bacillus sp. JJ1533 TaxID=3122959 RepID=UPI003000434B